MGIADQDAYPPDEVAGTGAWTNAELLVERSLALRASVARWKLQVVSVVDEMLASGNLMCVDALLTLLTLATGTVVLALTVSEVTSARGPRYYEPDFISERRTMHRDQRPADATLLCTERQFVGW